VKNDPTHSATAALLQRWREELRGGAKRVGWKIGLNDANVRRSLGLDEMVVGYLTDRTHFEPGAPCLPGSFQLIALEPEIAVHLTRPVAGDATDAEIRAAIGGIGPAIEVIAFDLPMGDVSAILGSNIFHKGVTFGGDGPARSGDSLEGLSVSTFRNGEPVSRGVPREVLGSLVPFVRLVANTLHAHGEELMAGDRIISGSLTAPLKVEPGDSVTSDFAELGAIELAVSGREVLRVERKLV
jgi:2-keto-4-pentenoate hydratase